MNGPVARMGGAGVRVAASGLLALVLIAYSAAAGAGSARAGSYVVSACLAAPHGENNAWSASAWSAHVTAYASTCDNITASGLTARTSVEGAGTTAPFLDNATWTFDAPAGAVVTQAELSAFIYRYGGAGGPSEAWATGLSDETGGYLWGNAGSTGLWSGTSPGSYITIPVPSRTHLQFGVVCGNLGGCTTASTGVYSPPVLYMRALTQLYGARVTVSDGSVPSLGGQRGGLYATAGWIGGTAAVGFDASDNVGIKTTSVALDGDTHSAAGACDYTRRVPCPSLASYDTSFNTAAVGDGDHTLALTAVDTAGNPLTSSKTVHVDNTAPGMPSAPSLQGAPSAQWRTANDFTVAYANPPAGGGSPAASSDVQVCPIDGQGQAVPTGCTTTAFATANGSNTFSVPSQGRFRARVRIHDALYTGAWSDWSSVLRFDDVVPGAARSRPLDGWVGAARRAGGLHIDAPLQSPAPASGIAGYAVTSDGATPGATVDLAAADPADGAAVLDLGGWPDGAYTVRVRAISGAGLASADADVPTTTVRIDTHPPDVGVDAPDTGAVVARPVTLVVTATDPLSGMDPAPVDQPVTGGGYVEYAIDGTDPVQVRGGTTRITTSDGHHVVTVSAVDVAGNRAPERTFVFTQDTTAPQGGMLAVDPAQPRRIAFLVAEDCIKSASIQVSTDGATWRPIDTKVDGRLVTGSVPDDIWDVRTPYHVRAQVTDCAGNQATLTTWATGAAAGSPIGTVIPPQREPVRIALTFRPLSPACSPLHRRGKRSSCQARARRSAVSAARRKIVSRTRTVSGRLVDSSGMPMAGRELQLQTQPRSLTGRWSTVRVLRTDARGRVTGVVRKFTSLRIRLVKQRDERYDTGTSNTLVTRVAAVSTIRATPHTLRNGEVVVFRGRLMGGWVPRSGLRIALYGFSPAKRQWLPVRTTVLADGHGRWRARYRFTATRTTVTYRFRVRIPARPDYPFAPGWSRRVAVGVRP